MSNAVITQSRAVLRPVEPGCAATCAKCDQPVKFVARMSPRQVIANVYHGGKWERVEHFHEECYAAANSPHGLPG